MCGSKDEAKLLIVVLVEENQLLHLLGMNTIGKQNPELVV